MRTIHAVVLSIPIGLAAGICGYTFVYAKGGSYLTNDPAACANCHVMQEQYDGWLKSSHRAVAVCNDCHTPHDVVGKYGTKFTNGVHHSYAFTTGRFPDVIRIAGPDLHRPPARRPAAGHLHALPRLGLRPLQEAR